MEKNVGVVGGSFVWAATLGFMNSTRIMASRTVDGRCTVT